MVSLYSQSLEEPLCVCSGMGLNESSASSTFLPLGQHILELDLILQSFIIAIIAWAHGSDIAVARMGVKVVP